jgi:DNA-binding XRE family transcriptional regulator
MNKAASEHPLRKLRRQKNLTQEMLARLLGVSQETISHWEIGRAKPSWGACRKLLHSFPELSLLELLGLSAGNP